MHLIAVNERSLSAFVAGITRNEEIANHRNVTHGSEMEGP